MTAHILVTDGNDRSALAVTRSLGRAGHRVVVGAPRLASLAGASRFAAHSTILPHPLFEPEAFVAAAGDAVRRFGCEIVIPVGDASSLALLSHLNVIAPARVPMPPLGTFRRASDKQAVSEAATSVGIRTPAQVRAATRDDLARLAATRPLAAPLVLKPSRSVVEDAGGVSRHVVQHAADWPEATALAATLPDGSFPLLVQERIVGPGTGIFVLLWDGRLVAAFAHRRIREKPAAGGVSVLCESVPMDEDLLARSRALLDHFGWDGVAMVEYKRDGPGGEPVLMEINGRFWGSLQLAIDAGVDFPRLLLECTSGGGGAPEAARSYRVGMRSRWWWGDLDHLVARLRHSDAFLHMPPDAPPRYLVPLNFVASGFAGSRGQVFQRDDPGPAWSELRDRVRELVGL